LDEELQKFKLSDRKMVTAPPKTVSVELVAALGATPRTADALLLLKIADVSVYRQGLVSHARSKKAKLLRFDEKSTAPAIAASETLPVPV
jgi:hypothetical protein